MKKPLFPSWYTRVFAAVLVMYLGLSLVYHSGFDGVRNKGMTLNFDREHDFGLYEINADYAFMLSSSNFIALVKYRPGIAPFCWLCGYYEPAGSVINGISHFKNGWVYSDFIGRYAEGLHTQTFEIFNIKPQTTIDAKANTPHSEYTKRQLNFEADYAIDADWITTNFRPLSTLNESCFVMQAAFLIVIILWGMIGVWLGISALIRGKR